MQALIIVSQHSKVTPKTEDDSSDHGHHHVKHTVFQPHLLFSKRRKSYFLHCWLIKVNTGAGVTLTEGY